MINVYYPIGVLTALMGLGMEHNYEAKACACPVILRGDKAGVRSEMAVSVM